MYKTVVIAVMFSSKISSETYTAQHNLNRLVQKPTPVNMKVHVHLPRVCSAPQPADLERFLWPSLTWRRSLMAVTPTMVSVQPTYGGSPSATCCKQTTSLRQTLV